MNLSFSPLILIMKGIVGKAMGKLHEWVYRTNERLIYYSTIFPFEREFTNKISSVEAFNVDIHSHTTYSDGLNTLHYSIWKARRRKLEGVGITDHDTVKHYPVCKRLQKKCDKHDFVVIAGTEYTATIEVEKDRVGIAHIVGLSPDYKPTREELKLIERTREVKKPKNFITCSLDLGTKENNVLPTEEVIDTLLDQGNVVVIAHYWTKQGVGEGKLKDLLGRKKYKEVAVEVINTRARIMPPNGVPKYVIKHGNLLANSDSHFARLTIGEAFSCFEESDVYGSNGRPSLDKMYEAIRKNRTRPYLVPLPSLARNVDRFRFLHVLHDFRSFMEYFDDDERTIAKVTNDVLVGKEIEESLENHHILPED